MEAQKHGKVLAAIENGPGKMAIAASLNEGMPVKFTIERKNEELRREALQEDKYIIRGQLQVNDGQDDWIIFIQSVSDKTIYVDFPKGYRCYYSTKTRKGCVYEN